jgi:hypothetical protein
VKAVAFALGLWWMSNTVAHFFIHRPFFRRRSANRLFATVLSVALGIPQALWRDRHLAHHAGAAPRVRLSPELILQIAVVGSMWGIMLDRAPAFFLSVYLPGYVGGLLLCAVHGHYEHAGGTISHYGRLYNLLLFNDGYHVEHHANPGVSWRRLPDRRSPASRASAWPAPLRWTEGVGSRSLTLTLELLERIVLRSPALQRFVLWTHERALNGLVATLPRVERVAIVGGGLFPRTALILRRLLPHARLTIVDANRANLDRAAAWLGGDGAVFVHGRYPGSDRGYDLVVIPLAFEGDRKAIYARPPAAAVIVHDWLWRRHGVGQVVSIALLKRVNLVRG